MAFPNPQRSNDRYNSEPPRSNWGLVLLFVAALVAAAYWQRDILHSSVEDEPTTYDPKRDRGLVSCWTALDCAALMAKDWQLELPLELGAATLESVTSSAGTMVFTRRLEYDRAYHEVAQYPDGKTWEQYEAEFAAVACDEYDHRPLITLGGRVIHRTIFSDGELMSELVIDRCDPK